MERILIVKSFAQQARFAAFVAQARAQDASVQVLACTGLHDMQALEPGSLPAGLWIAKTSSETSRSGLAHLAAQVLAPQAAPPIVLSAPLAVDLGEGFPTPERAASLAKGQQPAYMLIEGSVSDPAPMDAYRNIIFPLIRARGGHYLVYAGADQVEVLGAPWHAQFLAVSVWPGRALARDFWLCDRYQQDAIPTRTGAGQFSVLLA
jgi:uncharacterized protein (DUF1330 family)